MFNKILVLTGAPREHQQEFRLSDYKKLAADVFKNLDPASDIYFSQGPMDVLDHSCSKLGFGGKMCIDGTWKYDEERQTFIESAGIRFLRFTNDDVYTNLNGVLELITEKIQELRG